MNKSQALGWIGKGFRLRPIPIQLTATGERLPQEDAQWLVRAVTDVAATIVKVDADVTWELGLDNVREFRTPDFLLLRCQLTLQGRDVSSEPIIITSVDRNLTGFD